MTENYVEALVRVGPPTGSAKKQARKEQRALAAAALAAKHDVNVSAGWPESWTPAQVGRWTEAGGDLPTESDSCCGGTGKGRARCQALPIPFRLRH